MNGSGIVISAIVPVFNKGAYVHEALESIRQQGVSGIETIVVNDGSTDGSERIVDALPAAFPELGVRCFHKKNGGASDARNFGIGQARGEYVLNMDADDIMVPGFLSEALRLCGSEGADVVYSDLELFGDRLGEWIPHPFDPYFIRYDNCVPALALYRRSLWSRVGGYNVAFPFNEDWNFFVAVTRHTHAFRKISGKYFRYRQTGTGLYHNFIREAWEWGSCMLMTAQDDLYALDEVLKSCTKMQGMPVRWVDRFAQHAKMHPTSWLPHLWLGIAAEGRGDAQSALAHYQDAVKVSALTAWLPLYKLGCGVERIDPGFAIQAFHRARTMKPEISRIVNPKIDAIASASRSPTGSSRGA